MEQPAPMEQMLSFLFRLPSRPLGASDGRLHKLTPRHSPMVATTLLSNVLYAFSLGLSLPSLAKPLKIGT